MANGKFISDKYESDDKNVELTDAQIDELVEMLENMSGVDKDFIVGIFSAVKEKGEYFEAIKNFIKNNSEKDGSYLVDYMCEIGVFERNRSNVELTDAQINELTELLKNVSDTYEDFVYGVTSVVKDNGEFFEAVRDFVKNNPEKDSSDITEYLDELGI